MKRSGIFLMFALLAFWLIPSWAMGAQAAQAQPINLVIGGQAVEPDVPPAIQGGRTLVPVRVVAEELGAEVDWDPNTKKAVIRRDNKQLVLTIGSRTAQVDGKAVQLDTPPAIVNQRMLLPLRFVGESLGITVGWVESTRTVVANETPHVLLNGQAAPATIKFYLVDETMYVTAQAVAEATGQKDVTWKRPERGMTIDGQLVLPLERMESELDASIAWDEDRNRVEIERINTFTGVYQDGETVTLEMAYPVKPNDFVLTGPHRIVLDLPHTVLDEELVEEIARAEDEQRQRQDEEVLDEEADEREDEREQEDVQVEAEEESELIASLRYSQYGSSPDTVRVVIELQQKSGYELQYTNRGIEVKLKPQPKKTGYLIVVDAGHGGSDPGALGVAGNREKDFTLAVANKMVELLKQYPEFQVVPTRTTDVFLELSERVAIANEMGADLFLSIHANSFSNPNTGGTETYYYSANSKAFAEVVHKHLHQATGFANRGVKSSGFYVIKHTTMPAVLTETGFLSNPAENKQLMSPEFQEKVAKSLVAAIREYYQLYQ
ncbi:N-acetylmuramoyl-L-alanine amidase [Brevibacillus sp. TJ4]|uniref:N-acetylmuramoyl-L-alanine amidase n=1 Tax=Brevibacillus sp. TJ4 TaxID=3234853 RepID=UPI003B9EED97